MFLQFIKAVRSAALATWNYIAPTDADIKYIESQAWSVMKLADDRAATWALEAGETVSHSFWRTSTLNYDAKSSYVTVLQLVGETASTDQLVYLVKEYGLMCPYTNIVGSWSAPLNRDSIWRLSFNRLKGHVGNERHVHYLEDLEIMLWPCNFALLDLEKSELEDWIAAIRFSLACFDVKWSVNCPSVVNLCICVIYYLYMNYLY